MVFQKNNKKIWENEKKNDKKKTKKRRLVTDL